MIIVDGSGNTETVPSLTHNSLKTCSLRQRLAVIMFIPRMLTWFLQTVLTELYMQTFIWGVLIKHDKFAEVRTSVSS